MRFSVIGVIENISKNEFAPERITQTFQKEGNGFKERPWRVIHRRSPFT
jgi:hypothetical protein